MKKHTNPDFQKCFPQTLPIEQPKNTQKIYSKPTKLQNQSQLEKQRCGISDEKQQQGNFQFPIEQICARLPYNRLERYNLGDNSFQSEPSQSQMKPSQLLQSVIAKHHSYHAQIQENISKNFSPQLNEIKFEDQIESNQSQPNQANEQYLEQQYSQQKQLCQQLQNLDEFYKEEHAKYYQQAQEKNCIEFYNA